MPEDRPALVPGAREHIVHLFDASESLADAVAFFLAAGFRQGHGMLAVSTRAHWVLVAALLQRDGVPVDALIGERRLVMVDAGETLSRCLYRGEPHPALFDDAVGTLVRDLSASGVHLSIYGEMVELLAREADFSGACALERMWNRLAARYPMTVLCGYSAIHFGDSRRLADLRNICCAHTRATAEPSDVLAAWLLKQSASDASSVRKPS